MTRMCDLPYDLVDEKILAKVPITSLRAVRFTCKLWNALSKEMTVGHATSRQHEFLGFMTLCNKVFSVRFDLQGIHNHNNLVDSYVKKVAFLDQVEISKVFHCDDLVLCVTKDNSRLVVWNPYLGQTRRIRPRKHFDESDVYALGYNNNRNHKILRLLNLGRVVEFEIYDFSSDSWSVPDVTPNGQVDYYPRGVTLKGHTYFLAKVTTSDDEGSELILGIKDFLLCFDFTRERFGQRLPLPYNSSYANETVTISCVREEQLAVLYEKLDLLEIWVTNKFEPKAVSWRKSLNLDTTPLTRSQCRIEVESFFIDEKKKVVVVFNEGVSYIFGEDGYFKTMKTQETRDVLRITYSVPLSIVSSSYLPSLVQIKKPRERKRKERDA